MWYFLCMALVSYRPNFDTNSTFPCTLDGVWHKLSSRSVNLQFVGSLKPMKPCLLLQLMIMSQNNQLNKYWKQMTTIMMANGSSHYVYNCSRSLTKLLIRETAFSWYYWMATTLAKSNKNRSKLLKKQSQSYTTQSKQPAPIICNISSSSIAIIWEAIILAYLAKKRMKTMITQLIPNRL